MTFRLSHIALALEKCIRKLFYVSTTFLKTVWSQITCIYADVVSPSPDFVVQ